ncbi:hypothetical protein C4556_01435 [Candidatus Parcubacteria bacterium]|nr:MAG: hypothetical protein C4556_01435 [Candidatus Parcubacteria bacterium]
MLLIGLAGVATPAYGQTCVNGNLIDDQTGEVIGVCDPFQFQRAGIFGCNQTGSYSMNVGALSAVGGVYVPVNDAAVTLNTGYLVYKECVLDGISKRMGESASTGLVNKGVTDVVTGRNGGPLWPVDLAADVKERSNQSRLHSLESGFFSDVHPALRNDVIRATTLDYQARTQDPTRMLTCPYSGDIRAVWENRSGDILNGLLALSNPACNPLGATILAQYQADTKDAAAVDEMAFRLTTAQGFYGIEEFNPETGRYETRTPGSVVSGNLQQLLQSGFRQLENATEIDQMVGALFSGLSTQAISDSRGLIGLLQPSLGQPSYLDQMAREASQGLRDSAINAALQILSAARQVETTYFNAMNAIASNLTQTINQLRSAETSCWALVVPAAQAYANQNGFQITAATTTTASQQIIDSQISPLATTTVSNIARSQQALELINRLIAGITNTSSIESQRLALQQLDSLVAQGLLHNQYDAQQATQRREDVQTAMATLVEDTIVAWADSPDTNVGWCNVNNPEIGMIWAERWRR